MNNEPHQDIYFIGIGLPLDLEQQISQLQWQLYKLNKAMLRPLVPHVTLLNPPSLRGIMPSELLPRVRAIAKRYLPLTIALENVDFFGETVCFITVQSHQLDSLQSQLVKLLPLPAQEQHYRRPYRSHITLVQIYEPKKLNKQNILDTVDEKLILPQQFRVESVTYFKRILPREYGAEDI
jgi:2'-5' RNA ligase